jgi:hypothetical protein
VSASASDPMPVFVLKGKDALAPGTIAYYRRECDRHDLGAQATEVGAAFDEMAAWQQRNWTLVKLPDHPHVPVEANAEPWRFDVPEVPAHVTALRSINESREVDHCVWVRVEDAWALEDRWAQLFPDGYIGTARLSLLALAAYAPLVECPDPRAAS